MAKWDIYKRYYARYFDLREAQIIELDMGFDCRPAGDAVVFDDGDGKGPYFQCAHGYHYLAGQDDGDGYCVGVYPTSRGA